MAGPACNTGADAAGHVREGMLQAIAVVYFYLDMEPRSKADPAPLPASAFARLGAVRRARGGALSGRGLHP